MGSNGGLARYRLVVEPWLAFLRQRVDSYVFQGKTVVEIVEDLFADYAGAGALVPAWRWELSAWAEVVVYNGMDFSAAPLVDQRLSEN